MRLNYFKSIVVDTSSCRFIYVTGIDNLQNILQMRLYPNPTDAKVNIEFAETLKNVSIKIMNDKSETLKTISLTNIKNSQIDLSDFAPGVYFIEAQSDNAISHYRLLKQ
jgi:Secretion system C-terminal sorting domain